MTRKCRFIALVVTAVLVVAVPSQALAAIRLKKIAFNPAGADTGTNSHVNKEWVLIKNTGANSKDLDGWKIKDKGANNTFSFSGISLPGGDLLKLHSGNGSHRATSGCGGRCTVHHYYWDAGGYVWNNNGDKAVIKKPSGMKADSCAYSGGSSPKKC